MDVKRFFKRGLPSLLAAITALGLGAMNAHADPYIIPVNVGGTISGDYDVSAYAEFGNDYTIAYQTSASNPNLQATVSGLTIPNDSNTHVHDYSTGHNPRVEFGGTHLQPVSVDVNLVFDGANIFGSGLNTGGTELNPAVAREVDVVIGSINEDVEGTSGANATVTFATTSNTNFWGGVQFGGIDAANVTENAGQCTVIFTNGSTTTFQNQNTYFGAGGYNVTTNNNGGKANVIFAGGNTTFNQRAVFGGGTCYTDTMTAEDGVAVGDSNITFAGGTNTFTDTNVNWPNDGSFGNQKNYYGVFFSAIGGSGGIAKAGAATVNIGYGSTNNFDAEVHVGGNYNFTPYGDIIRSKDDFNVTWGGTNNFTVTGGVTTFGGRTTFGAPNSTTNVTLSGGTANFAGTKASLNMGKGDILEDIPFSSEDTIYNGQDTPFVFFGGKYINPTQNGADAAGEDIAFWNEYYADYDSPIGNHGAFIIDPNQIGNVQPVTNIVLNGRANVILKTTAFVGGANYNYLAGSSDLTSALQKDFVYGAKGTQVVGDNPKAFTNDTVRYNTHANTQDTDDPAAKVYDFEYEGTNYTHNIILNDAGTGTMTLTGGARLTLGLYNTTQLYNSPDEIILANPDTGTNEPATPTASAGYTLNRNSQVQIIGNNAQFTANDGRLFFTVQKNGTQCLNEDGVLVDRLNAGRLVFNEITINENTDIFLDVYNNKWCSLIGQDGQDKEYYTIETFVDTDGTQLKIGHENSTGQYVYQRDYAFYSVGVEDLADANGNPSPNFKDEARLHVIVHDPHSVVPDGNLGNNMDDYLEDLCDEDEPADLREALDDIWNSADPIEAREKFDDLAGGTYGDWFNAQTQRLTHLNSMLANRTLIDDSGLDQFCCQCQCEQSCGDFQPYGCEQPRCPRCCARRQCSFGGNLIGRQPRFCQPRSSVWGSFIGNYGDGNYWKGFTKYHEESTGLAVGMEWRTVDCDKIGVYFGYTDSAVTHGNSAGNSFSKVESDDYTWGLYAKWDAFAMGGYGFANANFSYSDIDAERIYSTQVYDNQMFGNTNGISASVYLERGWMCVEKHGFVINPYLSLQYAYLQMDDFTETGGSIYGEPAMDNLRLHCYDMDYHTLRGQIGVRVSRDFVVGCQNWQILRLTLGGAYMHEFLDPQADYYTEIVGDVNHKQWWMNSNGCSRDWANVVFNMNYKFTQRITADASYNAYFNQYKTVNAFSASLRFDF